MRIVHLPAPFQHLLTKVFFVTSFVLCSHGCLLGPIASEKTARTLGKGNIGISTGVNGALPNATIEYGVSDNIDLHLTGEYQFGTLLATGGKMAFIRNEQGLNVALSAGLFNSIQRVQTNDEAFVNYSGGPYVSPIVSYKRERIEPYLFLKTTLSINDSLGVLPVVLTGSGVNLWLNPRIGLNLNGKAVLYPVPDLIPSANLLLRF